MEINFLSSLDLLISFGVVMLLATSVVTAFVQLALEVLKQRTKVLQSGIAGLLQQAGLDEQCAKSVAEEVIAHRMVGADASVIQREKLIQILLDLAARKAELSASLTKLVGANPQQTLDSILARAGELEATHPHLAEHVRQTFAIVESTKQSVASGVNSLLAWFDDSCDRMSHEFAKRSRVVTIAASFAVAFALPLDSIELLRNLARDPDQAARLVATASSVIEKAQPAVPAKSLSDAQETLTQSLAELKAATGAAITLGRWNVKDGLWWVGVIITGLLLSLGAPFWFDVVKKGLRLRSALAEKDAADRDQRVSAQQPAGDLPALNRQAEEKANSKAAGSNG
jgi:hypothetical protein